jgi:hypothetical protein
VLLVMSEWHLKKGILVWCPRSNGSWETLQMEILHIWLIISNSRGLWMETPTQISLQLMQTFTKDGTITLGTKETSRNSDSIDSMEVQEISA